MSNLAITMRPSTLDQVIGQSGAKAAIKKFLDSGKLPNAFLFYGPPGTGKTTLAWIIARSVQPEDTYIWEINGSDKNGVDDARQLAQDSESRPFNGQSRVIIIDEAHRMTPQAQDCLLIPLEREDSNTIWIFCSTDPGKLIPALKSRCSAATFEVKPLDDSGICDLLSKINPQLLKDSVGKFLWEHRITAPREILGVVDQYLSGVPLEECVHGSEHEPLYKDVASAVLSGNWTKAASLLGRIKTADYRGMISVVSAFLASDLLKEPIGPRADAIATCLVGIGNSNFADGVAYAATKALLYKCAKALGGGR